MVNFTVVNMIKFAVINCPSAYFWTLLIDNFIIDVISEGKYMSMGSLTEDHNVTNARKDLKPITKFHSIGITPGEDFFF